MALAGALIFWIIPAQTVPAIFASVPSGFYPDFTSTLLLVSGAGLAVSGFFTDPEPVKDAPKTAAFHFIAALVLLAGSMLLTPYLGFVPVGVMICLTTLLLMRENRWGLVALISCLAPVGIWAMFELLLGRPLP